MTPSADRLRARSRIAGLLLTLSFFLPVETANDGPQLVWRLAPDLALLGTWVLVAPAVCGALVVVASFGCKRAASLAIVVLALIAVLLVASAGAETLAWDMLPPPEPWSRGPAPGLLAVALVAASLSVDPMATGRRAAPALRAVAAVAALAHLVLPAGGESPLVTVARVSAHVASASGPGNLLGASVLSLVVLWPGLAVAVGWAHARRPAPRPRSTVAVLAAYAAPVLLLPVAQRSMLDPWGRSGSAMTTIAAVVMLAAVLVVLASALVVVAESPAALLRERRTGLVAVGAVALAALGPASFPTRSRAGADWRPGPPTADGDRLFGTLLPAWNDAHSGDDLADRRTALGSSAERLDAGLAAAILTLAAESGGPELMERRWYSLVERVNEASRRASLPYYVDPTEVVVAGDPARRWFRIDTYRIERVNRFGLAGTDLATLHVRAMVPERTRRVALGLSRDVQPFAVIVLDEIEAYERELEQLAAQAPPRCGEGPVDGQAAEEALRACGDDLGDLARRNELRAALVEATERHELQHQIDGPSTPRSRWLGSRLAWHAPEPRARIQRELSAYLAQMTAAGSAPRVTLLRLLRLALLVRRGAEHEVALLALEALGEGEPGEPRGESIARTYGRLSRLDDLALRERAANAWRAVYGRDLASPVARP